MTLEEAKQVHSCYFGSKKHENVICLGGARKLLKGDRHGARQFSFSTLQKCGLYAITKLFKLSFRLGQDLPKSGQKSMDTRYHGFNVYFTHGNRLPTIDITYPNK